MINYRLFLFYSIFVFSQLSRSTLTLAQFSDQYTHLDSAKGYWRLKADKLDQKPIVQFFNSQHQLLYQETLLVAQPITANTQRIFDKLLYSFTTSRLLATAFLADQKTSFSSVINSVDEIENLKQIKIERGVAVLSVDPKISQDGALTIDIAQQTQQFVRVVLENEDQTVSFFDVGSSQPVSKWVVKLDLLDNGHYTVRVGYAQFTYMYRLTVDRKLNTYALHNYLGDTR